MRGLPYDVKALVEKARETALLAVETYNRPTASFRSGAYVVLMIIAWTSLFHALFLRKGIKPHYRKPGSKQYDRIDGEPRRWELKECVQQYYKANNPAARRNLEFFIGLRNKIEHHSLAQVDPEVFVECQAMLLTIPDKPRSRMQRYRTTEAGLAILRTYQVSPSSARRKAPMPRGTQG